MPGQTSACGAFDDGDRWRLRIDHALVRSAGNVAFTLQPARKHPANPGPEADRPCEEWLTEIYGTVLYDRDWRGCR